MIPLYAWKAADGVIAPESTDPRIASIPFRSVIRAFSTEVLDPCPARSAALAGGIALSTFARVPSRGARGDRLPLSSHRYVSWRSCGNSEISRYTPALVAWVFEL